MSETVTMNDRDQVLLQFHTRYPRPTAADVIEWMKRYPKYAEDIQLHAAIAREWHATDALGEEASEPISDVMMDRARSRTLNALYRSESQPSGDLVGAVLDFHEMLRADGREIYNLAKDLDVGRDVLHDLFNGWMDRPVGGRLVDAICTAFRITTSVFDSALEQAITHPRLGQAKSDVAPRIRRRTYEEIVKGSSMKDDRKKFWLEDC